MIQSEIYGIGKACPNHLYFDRLRAFHFSNENGRAKTVRHGPQSVFSRAEENFPPIIASKIFSTFGKQNEQGIQVKLVHEKLNDTFIKDT